MFLDFGFSASNLQGFHNELGQFLRLEGEVRLQTMEQLNAFALAMVEDLKASFIEGTAPGGDRTGTNSSNKPPGYVPTIDTFRVDNRVPGMWTRIVMGGAADYIENGWLPHTISAHLPPDALHFFWQKMDGEELFVKSVWNPGYTGDRFVERPYSRLEVQSFLNNIANRTFARLFSGNEVVALPTRGSLAETLGPEYR